LGHYLDFIALHDDLRQFFVQRPGPSQGDQCGTIREDFRPSP